MKIGVPKEIKIGENRVGMTPSGVAELVKHGHSVVVQAAAGIGSGFADSDYTAAGASILPTVADVYACSDMIVKVKEPIAQEYPLIRKGQIVFTYFHFACDRKLTEAMIRSSSVCIAYETVQLPDGSLPLLIPMSEVAGRLGMLNGAYYLQKTKGGKGKLACNVPGVEQVKVVVLGGGIVGQAAARIAAGMGCRVVITDISLHRLRELSLSMPANVATVYSSHHNIVEEIRKADVIIGAVLVPGDKAPHLITRDMLSLLEPGTVLVDVAIDQGGCFETSHPTTHDDPVYVVDGIIHYAVANIPGAVPSTSTAALTNATLQYAVAIADKGWRKACKDDLSLCHGLNIIDGNVVIKPVADVFGMEYTPVSSFLDLI